MPRPARRLRFLPWCLPAGAWAATAVADGVAQLGGGLADGARRVGMALGHLLGHPLATVDGIALALTDRRQGFAAWHEAAARLWAGLSADPAGAAGSALSLLACAAGCVVVAGGLSWAGGRLWQAAAGRRPARRPGGRIGVLHRARAMRLERRRGASAGAWPWAQRLRYVLEDGRDTLRVVWRHGGAGAGFLLMRGAAGLGRGVAGLLREGGRQLAYLAFPLVLLAGPWIDLAIQRASAAEAAAAQLVPAARAFVAEVPALDPAALSARASALRQAYAAHRQRLLAPVRGLDARLESELAQLEAQVAAGALPDAAIDHRLEGALMRFASDRLRWLAVLVLPLPAVSPEPLAVPQTWFESRAVEAAVFAAARERVGDPVRAALLDALLAGLAAEWDEENCLRTWDASLLLETPLPRVDACRGRP